LPNGLTASELLADELARATRLAQAKFSSDAWLADVP
jgi:hypothetical protein